MERKIMNHIVLPEALPPMINPYRLNGNISRRRKTI